MPFSWATRDVLKVAPSVYIIEVSYHSGTKTALSLQRGAIFTHNNMCRFEEWNLIRFLFLNDFTPTVWLQ